jgi:hypothetical protein
MARDEEWGVALDTAEAVDPAGIAHGAGLMAKTGQKTKIKQNKSALVSLLMRLLREWADLF